MQTFKWGYKLFQNMGEKNQGITLWKKIPMYVFKEEKST